MLRVKNEKDLNKLGIALDSNDPTKVVALNGNGKAKQIAPSKHGKRAKFTKKATTSKSGKPRKRQSDQEGKFVSLTSFADVPPPKKSWGIDQLDPYIQVQHEQIRYGERKLAIHTYRLGQALILAKKKVGHGEWGKFLKKHRISDSTWSRARQLVERSNEADLGKLGIHDAYLKYGIPTQPVEEPATEAEAKTDKRGIQKATATQGEATADTIRKGATKVTTPKTAAKKTSPETTAHDVVESSEEDETTNEVKQIDDEEEDFDAWALLEEFAKRNGWDHQRQVQLMVDYWAEDILPLLMDVGDEAEFREFLAEQEKLPPPKENRNSPLPVLVMLRNRLDMLAKEVVDWKKEPAGECLALLDEIASIAQQIEKGVPHA
ncbi:MAG: hypothetical protein ACLQNE_27790 [Thermoguttaceae bacterium]